MTLRRTIANLWCQKLCAVFWTTLYIVTMRLSGTVMEINLWHLKVHVHKHTNTETDTRNDGQIDQFHNLLQCSLRSHTLS